MENIDDVLEKWMAERSNDKSEDSEWSYEDIVEAFKFGVQYGMKLCEPDDEKQTE